MAFQWDLLSVACTRALCAVAESNRTHKAQIAYFIVENNDYSTHTIHQLNIFAKRHFVESAQKYSNRRNECRFAFENLFWIFFSLLFCILIDNLSRICSNKAEFSYMRFSLFPIIAALFQPISPMKIPSVGKSQATNTNTNSKMVDKHSGWNEFTITNQNGLIEN